MAEKGSEPLCDSLNGNDWQAFKAALFIAETFKESEKHTHIPQTKLGATSSNFKFCRGEKSWR